MIVVSFLFTRFFSSSLPYLVFSFISIEDGVPAENFHLHPNMLLANSFHLFYNWSQVWELYFVKRHSFPLIILVINSIVTLSNLRFPTLFYINSSIYCVIEHIVANVKGKNWVLHLTWVLRMCAYEDIMFLYLGG